MMAIKYPDTEENVEEKREFVAQQTKQAKETGLVTIRSNTILTIPLWMAFRCLYCGEYFNQSGAEEHFGMTREEYFAKPPKGSN